MRSSVRACARIAAAATAAVATATLATPSASASPSWDLWTLANNAHTAAGCQPYGRSPAVEKTVGSIANTIHNPPPAGSIAGNGRIPTDVLLADNGYFQTSYGEADYVNNSGNATAQDAMNYWMTQNTREIFPNCGMHDLETAVYTGGGKWVAVLLVATPGGTPGAPPKVN